MNLLCWLFGHRSMEDVHSGAEYMAVRREGVDGIKREHARLIARCPRCGESYRAGRIHLPETQGQSEYIHWLNARLTKAELELLAQRTEGPPAFVVDHVGMSYGEGMENTTVIVGHSLDKSALFKGARLYRGLIKEQQDDLERTGRAAALDRMVTADEKADLYAIEATRVCPVRDAVCGDRAEGWCDSCPKKAALKLGEALWHPV